MLLLEHLRMWTAMSVDFETILVASVSLERYLPHQVIGAAGQSSTKMWWVASGLIRQYYFDASGKEHTVAFFREQELLFSLGAFAGEKSEYYVEALEDSDLYTLPYQALEERLAVFPETKILTGRFLRQYDERERLKERLLLLSAPERYRLLRQSQNWLFSRVSVKLIATYLNMTRENLSRLMSRDH